MNFLEKLFHSCEYIIKNRFEVENYVKNTSETSSTWYKVFLKNGKIIILSHKPNKIVYKSRCKCKAESYD